MTRGNNTRAGFTIIETVLFIALTGVMMIGAMLGIGTNIARARYRDAVEDIVSILRDQYEQVNRTQISKRPNDGSCAKIIGGGVAVDTDGTRGRSKCSVYGVAITFGLGNGDEFESTTLIGKDIVTYEKELKERTPPENISDKSDLAILSEIGLTNVIDAQSSPTSPSVCKAVNVVERKKYNWGAKIMDTDEAGGADRVKKATVLIFRSPRDGTVHTYAYDYSNKSEPVADVVKSTFGDCNTVHSGKAIKKIKDEITHFTNSQPINLCIASDDALATYGKRRMITIAADGHGSTAVSLIDMDDPGGANRCK